VKGKKKGGALKDRLKKSYADKDRGGNGIPAFDWKKAGDVKFIKMAKGWHKFDIIPFKIKSANHPLVKSGDMKVGDLDYYLDVMIHRSVGPTQSDIICPKKNFARNCPICDLAEKYKNEGKEKEFNALKPKRVAYYNVIDTDNEKDGIQILAVSHANFEKELIDAANEADDNGDIVDFPDINEGKTVKFRASPATFAGHQYFEFKSFQFVDRDEARDESLIDDAVSFDSFMKIYKAEELEKLLYGNEEQEESERVEDDDSDEDEESEDEDDDDSDEEEESDDDADEEEEEESDDEEDESDDEEEEDDDNEEEEEEEEEEDEKPKRGRPAKPTPKKASAKKAAPKKSVAKKKPVAAKLPVPRKRK
jgi:hypothetical protein